MTLKLLIAYASKHGSTKEVAEAIAEKVRKLDLEVELRRAADVDDLTPYDGVVLGGSLYFGRWHEDAVRYSCQSIAGSCPISPLRSSPLAPRPPSLGIWPTLGRSSRTRCRRLTASSRARSPCSGE